VLHDHAQSCARWSLARRRGQVLDSELPPPAGAAVPAAGAEGAGEEGAGEEGAGEGAGGGARGDAAEGGAEDASAEGAEGEGGEGEAAVGAKAMDPEEDAMIALHLQLGVIEGLRDPNPPPPPPPAEGEEPAVSPEHEHYKEHPPLYYLEVLCPAPRLRES
jgi:hypothetical protein